VANKAGRIPKINVGHRSPFSLFVAPFGGVGSFFYEIHEKESFFSRFTDRRILRLLNQSPYVKGRQVTSPPTPIWRQAWRGRGRWPFSAKYLTRYAVFLHCPSLESGGSDLVPFSQPRDREPSSLQAPPHFPTSVPVLFQAYQRAGSVPPSLGEAFLLTSSPPPFSPA